MIKLAIEQLPQNKIDLAEAQLKDIQGKTWSSPKEFADLFKSFDSDVRMAIPKLVRANNTPDSQRVLQMVNLVGYLGTSYDSVEHRAINDLLEKLFPSSTQDKRLEYIVQALLLWVPKTRGIRLKKALEALEDILGGSFAEHWELFKAPNFCKNFITKRRKEVAELDKKTEQEQSRKEMAKIIKTTAIYEDAIGTVQIILALLLDRYTYIPATLDLSYDKEGDNKLTVYISLAKLYKNI